VQQLPLGVRLPDRAVFASFLVGDNAQAVQHLQRVAAGASVGLTWLCGAGGSGKSHLLQATCSAAGEHERTGYLPLAQMALLGTGVLEGMTQLRLLAVDDIEAVAGQRDWERALFGVLREFEESGGRLILAAASPPALLGWALPDLGSRCAASTVYQLRALSEEEQHAALQLRARLRGLEVPPETWVWLQRRLPRDMRALYEALDRLDEAALSAQRRLTVPFIREVLAGRAPDNG
jgi:DnaA-homolog protein